MKYNYVTNLGTIKKVYGLLNELNLIDLASKQVDIKQVVQKLLQGDYINEFCSLVAGQQEDWDSKDLLEIEEIILGFFVAGKGLLENSLLLKSILALSQQQALKIPSTNLATPSGDSA